MKKEYEYRWCVLVTPNAGYLNHVQEFTARQARETKNLYFLKHETFSGEERHYKNDARAYWFDSKLDAMGFADRLNKHLKIEELKKQGQEYRDNERAVRQQISDIVANGLPDEE